MFQTLLIANFLALIIYQLKDNHFPRGFLSIMNITVTSETYKSLGNCSNCACENGIKGRVDEFRRWLSMATMLTFNRKRT